MLGDLPQLLQALASQIPVGPGTRQENTLQKEAAVEGSAPFNSPRRIHHGLGDLLRGLEFSLNHPKSFIKILLRLATIIRILGTQSDRAQEVRKSIKIVLGKPVEAQKQRPIVDLENVARIDGRRPGRFSIEWHRE